MTTAKLPTLSDAAGEPAPDATAPRDESRLTVDVRYRVGTDGPEHTGAIVLRAPSAWDDVQIGRAKARLCSGLPWESFDEPTRDLFTAMAVCQTVIEEAPPWFKALALSGVHADLYLGLYGSWAAFAAGFFRERSGEGGAETARSALEIRPRLRAADGAGG